MIHRYKKDGKIGRLAVSIAIHPFIRFHLGEYGEEVTKPWLHSGLNQIWINEDS
jgi:hypothetical protein